MSAGAMKTPWLLVERPNGIAVIISADGRFIADWGTLEPEAKANVELMVLAVNAHADLLTTVRLFVDAADEFAAENGEWRHGGPMGLALHYARPLIAKAAT